MPKLREQQQKREEKMTVAKGERTKDDKMTVAKGERRKERKK